LTDKAHVPAFGKTHVAVAVPVDSTGAEAHKTRVVPWLVPNTATVNSAASPPVSDSATALDSPVNDAVVVVEALDRCTNGRGATTTVVVDATYPDVTLARFATVKASLYVPAAGNVHAANDATPVVSRVVVPRSVYVFSTA
jgi:hypothetical protein